MTESTEDGIVGIPAKSDSIAEREAAATEADASAAERSEGELPGLVVAAACGIGSASARAARPRTMMLLEIISTGGLLEMGIFQWSGWSSKGMNMKNRLNNEMSENNRRTSQSSKYLFL